MHKQTSLVAKRIRLQEWASHIQACQSRPKGITVQQWCDQNGITRDNYYYHLSAVRKACLDQLPVEKIEKLEKHESAKHSVVPVSIMDLPNEIPSTSTIDLEVNGIIIHVTDSASTELLKKVLQVTAYVE
ncbi:MAG: IS66 family insertion sequence element accessory protein TnpB [Eubacterium sp.]|nr:IS66 family insertion sequence element accessory protein TnpB [Eubacterium sp.]